MKAGSFSNSSTRYLESTSACEHKYWLPSMAMPLPCCCSNFAVQGTEASVWWYAVDDCPVRAFLDSGRRSPPAGPLRVKCEAAVRLQELFLPTPDVSSLFADRAPPLLPFRRELLPTTTQRILAAAGGFAPPLSNELQARLVDGGGERGQPEAVVGPLPSPLANPGRRPTPLLLAEPLPDRGAAPPARPALGRRRPRSAPHARHPPARAHGRPPPLHRALPRVDDAQAARGEDGRRRPRGLPRDVSAARVHCARRRRRLAPLLRPPLRAAGRAPPAHGRAARRARDERGLPGRH